MKEVEGINRGEEIEVKAQDMMGKGSQTKL